MESVDVEAAGPTLLTTASESSNETLQLQAAVAGQLVLEHPTALASASGAAASVQPGVHSGDDAQSLSFAAVDTMSAVRPAAASMESPPASAHTAAPGMASAIPPAAAPAAAAADDWGDDDFGDFDAAPALAAPQLSSTPAALPASTPAAAVAAGVPVTTAAAPTASGNDDWGDDDFGDFGDATSFSGANTASATGTAPTQPVVTVPAAAAAQSAAAVPAVPEGPDILQLSGQDFLAAVLEAWPVLGAPAAHAAAAAQQPSAQDLQQLQAVQLQLPQTLQQQASRVMSHCGLPLNIDSQQHQHQQQQQHEDNVDSCLQWHGSASEGRLVDLLGMSQAVKRAMAAMNKEHAAAAAAAAAGGSASGPS